MFAELNQITKIPLRTARNYELNERKICKVFDFNKVGVSTYVKHKLLFSILICLKNILRNEYFPYCTFLLNMNGY